MWEYVVTLELELISCSSKCHVPPPACVPSGDEEQPGIFPHEAPGNGPPTEVAEGSCLVPGLVL